MFGAFRVWYPQLWLTTLSLTEVIGNYSGMKVTGNLCVRAATTRRQQRRMEVLDETQIVLNICGDVVALTGCSFEEFKEKLIQKFDEQQGCNYSEPPEEEELGL